MIKRKVYERFVDLPIAVQDFFMEKADKVYFNFIDKHGFEDEMFFEQIERPILNAVLGFATVENSLQTIYKNLLNSQIQKDDIKIIIRTLLEKVFWPIRDIFDTELTAYLTELGIDSTTWSKDRLLFKPISYSGASSEVLNRLGMSSAGRSIRTGLRDLIAKMHKGEFVPDQAKEAMIRLPEFGGLGFDKAAAEKAVQEISILSKQVEFFSEEEYAEQLTAKSVKMNGGSRAENEAVEDENEIKTIRDTLPPKPKAVTALDKSIEAAWESLQNKPTDEYLQNRIKNVISSRLRDIRSQQELLSLLQRDTKVGGVGLNRDEAQAMASAIEQAYQNFHQNIKNEEKQKLDKQLTEQKRKIEERRKREAEEHAKWYQEKIKAKHSHEEEQKQLAEALKKGLATRSQTKHPLTEAGAMKEKKQFGELVRATEASKVKSLRQEPGVAEAVAQKPIKVSKATMKIDATPKTMVDGVNSAPRLSGLLGELEDITLAQFRRMGANPEDSIKKILDKMETLRQDSFEQRVGGIRAWQASPLMKLYLNLVTESFRSKKPLAEVAEEKRKNGEDTLTRDEIEALINLNNQLHF
jgi:hypothetical protein